MIRCLFLFLINSAVGLGVGGILPIGLESISMYDLCFPMPFPKPNSFQFTYRVVVGFSIELIHLKELCMLTNAKYCYVNKWKSKSS